MTNEQFREYIETQLNRLTPRKRQIAIIAIRRVLDNLAAEPPVIESDIDMIIRTSTEILAELDEIREREGF